MQITVEMELLQNGRLQNGGRWQTGEGELEIDGRCEWGYRKPMGSCTMGKGNRKEMEGLQMRRGLESSGRGCKLERWMANLRRGSCKSGVCVQSWECWEESH